MNVFDCLIAGIMRGEITANCNIDKNKPKRELQLFPVLKGEYTYLCMFGEVNDSVSVTNCIFPKGSRGVGIQLEVRMETNPKSLITKITFRDAMKIHNKR